MMFFDRFGRLIPPAMAEPSGVKANTTAMTEAAKIRLVFCITSP
jgi:hypothetical protein